MAFLKLNLSGRKKSQDLLGIDLNEERLKIAHIRLSGLRREVAALAAHEVRGMTDEEISGILEKTLKEWKLAAPRAYISVPMHSVITRSIEIPSRDPDEIREIVSLQASRHTPYSRSEIIIDTLHIGVLRDSYTKVLLVIVPRDLVTRQTRILERAKLKLDRVFFPPEGITLACAKILASENSSVVTAIVHMDTAFTSFMVSQKGRILFVRGISIGADHLLQEKEVYSDRFVDELQKSLETYLTDEGGARPTMLLLTGVVAETNDLDDLFSETLGMPIKHQTYFNHFTISEPAKRVASTSREVSYFNPIAPVLLFDRMKIDLISEEMRLKRQLEKRGQEMLRSGILLMVILVIAFVFIAERIYFKSAYLESLAARYRPAKEDAGQLEQTFLKTQVIKDYLASRGKSVEALITLYDILPQDVRISNIRYENGERFTVKGTSRTMASVFAFVSSLEKSDLFKGAKTKYVTSRNEDGTDVADFEIAAAIERAE